MSNDPSDNEYERALAGWLTPAHPPPPPEEDAEDGLFGSKRSEAHFAALEQVKEWTRQRFKLADDAAIVVTELTCALPGCPPLETAIAFWEGETRYHFKMLRPVAEVEPDQLPYAWQKDSLSLPEGFGCDCC